MSINLKPSLPPLPREVSTCDICHDDISSAERVFVHKECAFKAHFVCLEYFGTEKEHICPECKENLDAPLSKFSTQTPFNERFVLTVKSVSGMEWKIKWHTESKVVDLKRAIVQELNIRGKIDLIFAGSTMRDHMLLGEIFTHEHPTINYIEIVSE